jgi:GTP diphosphokinase / guanosine-3',5'-bis(diphosphate) 3'-diphosphatase
MTAYNHRGGMWEDVQLPILVRALRFAADKHRSQRRLDVQASPYINHPIAVLSILCEEGGIDEEAVLCAGVLHDTIEDTEATPEELAGLFGPRVRDIVLAVSDDKRLPKAERKQLQIEHAAAASREAKLVKLADKIANLRDLLEHPPKHWDQPRLLGYTRWAGAVIDGVRGTHPRLEALFDATYARCLRAYGPDVDV